MSLSTEIMKMMLEHSYDGITYTDENGIIQYVNRSYSEITGLSQEFILSNTLYDLLAKDYPIATLFHKIFEDKAPCSEVINYGSDRRNEILVTGIPVFDEEEIFRGVFGNIRDITDLNNLKSEIHTIHHEYRQELDNQKQITSALLKKINALTAKEKDFHISGSEKTIQWLFELSERISSVDSTILITGESGVGKDVFAKLVHHIGQPDKPFVKISCGAIPESLLESELFGYEPGSFTGAGKHGKPGIFELAEDGIIFLDEIGEMPLMLQVKLLTVLQDRKFFRIGGVKEKIMRARVISATNKDLMHLVERREFRNDLYYRLNVIPVHIPPLRERKEDILPIALHILNKINAKNQTEKRFSWDLERYFMQYPWPGNIRELNNIIERIYVFSPENKLSSRYLPSEILSYCSQQVQISLTDDVPLKKRIEAYEKDIICRMIKSNLTINEIAEKLDVSSSTIVRKIQKYNLQRKGMNILEG